MKIIHWNALSTEERAATLQRPALSSGSVEGDVSAIISRVRNQGIDAVHQYTKLFDEVDRDDLIVMDAEKDAQIASLALDARTAIDTACKTITNFHKRQGIEGYTVETAPGVLCERRVLPLERVGLYIPGGSAPLVSTVLMLAIPAVLAGCQRIVLCTPPATDGMINPAILYAAQQCGVSEIFAVGGAQAIAAMAYGAGPIPQVDKIFGPGNVWVTEAKRQVGDDPAGAAIDMPAGPSEVCVIANAQTPPAFAAADLLSQAEHDSLSQVLLLADSEDVIKDILGEVETQILPLSRREIARTVIANSVAIVTDTTDGAIEVANAYAAEHLILCFDGAEQYINRIKNAGSVFLGPWSPEAAGDYCSGTNHALPTYGYAKRFGGVTVEAFQKTMTVQTLSREGLEGLAPTIDTLARLEGLDAHAQAVAVRVGA